MNASIKMIGACLFLIFSGTVQLHSLSSHFNDAVIRVTVTNIYSFRNVPPGVRILHSPQYISLSKVRSEDMKTKSQSDAVP